MELKWKSCIRIGVTVIILFLVMQYWPAFTKLARIALGAAMPLLLGCAVAYVVNILMSFAWRLLLSAFSALRSLLSG